MNINNTIILVALEDELPETLTHDFPIYYTGVGKVNAAIQASRLIIEKKPKNIINFGTAGALNNKFNGLVSVKKVIQRDMDVRPLGIKLGETPFEKIHEYDLS